MKCKKKRRPGLQVKKYQFGGSVTGPMLMPSDATRVAMPDLQFQPVLQPLPTEQLPVGPTIGPATPIDEERYNRDMRRRDAIARGINPNLAFTMPPGLQGDPQAAAEYQYDNMMTSPIGQIATAMAFTPIDVGIEAALPFIPSTYAGRQLNRFGEYVGTKASQKGEEVMRYVQRTDPQVLKGTADLQAMEQTGRGLQAQLAERQKEYLTDPILQDRMRARLTGMLQSKYDEVVAKYGMSGQQLQNHLRSIGPGSGGFNFHSALADDLRKIEGAMVGGKIDKNSLLVTEALTKQNQKVAQTTLDFQSMAGKKPMLDADQIAAHEAQLTPMLERRKQLKFDKKNRIGDPDEIDLELSALESDIQKLQTEIEISTTGFFDAEAYAKHGGGPPSIYIGGQRLVDPKTGRIITEHEIEHVLQRPADNLFNSSLFDAYDLREADPIAKELMEMVPRKVSRSTDDVNLRLFDEAQDYFEKQMGGMPNKNALTPGATHPSSVAERTPFLAELRQDMIDKGVISGRNANVTEQDILRFVDDHYAPEKRRMFADMAFLNEPESLRILELFPADARNAAGVSNAKVMADQMNKLSAVLIGTGGAAAATQDFKYGGKFKIKKKKKPGYRTV